MSDTIAAPPPQKTERKITLQVGERKFATARETLTTKSAFFASLLSGRWDNAQEDGSYFIDADPGLFEHILRYLRRGVLPIFYDKVKGFDHALYIALLAEAKYFQIPQLEKWLEDKRYLDVVKVQCSGEQFEEFNFQYDFHKLPRCVDAKYYPKWATKKVYVCPRGISVHRGSQDACGRACLKARGDDDVIYEEETILRLLVMREEVVIDGEACQTANLHQTGESELTNSTTDAPLIRATSNASDDDETTL